ncbi:hypothetical protein TI04_13595, partial [Achromatium sp. WMS2]
LEAFSTVFERGLNSPEYKAIVNERESGFKSFQKSFEFYDIFLINATGDIVYTLLKESDLGANLITGNLRDSGLARLFTKAQNGTAIEDFSYYEPSKGMALFIGTPILRPDGTLAGVVALQISRTALNTIAQNRIGLGKLSESFIVGRGKDGIISLRSDRIVKTGQIGDVYTHKTARNTLEKAETGYDVSLGSTGLLELIVHQPISIPGLNWGVLTTANMEELLTSNQAIQ